MTILKHFKETYGAVSQEDLHGNEALMNIPWDHTTPLETLFARIKKCQEYAAKAGEEPIDDCKIIHVIYMHISMAGIFNEACDTWDDIAAVNKTRMISSQQLKRKANTLQVRQGTQ